MFEFIKKRGAQPVPSVEGAFVRLLTYGERVRAAALDKDLAPFFVLGKCLVNEAGKRECQQGEEEPDEDFARSIADAIEREEIPGVDIDAIGAEYKRLCDKGGAPKTADEAADLAKN